MRIFRVGSVSAADIELLRRLQCAGNRGSYPWICCEQSDSTVVDGRTDLQFPTEQGGEKSVTQPPPPTGQPSTDGNGAQKRGGQLPEPGMCGVDAFGQRIYGGEAAGINEFPWMALLEYRNTSKINNLSRNNQFVCVFKRFWQHTNQWQTL